MTALGEKPRPLHTGPPEPPTAPSGYATIRVEAEVTLALGDLWPDDDWPEKVTAESVAQLVRSAGRKSEFLDEWALIDELDVSVAWRDSQEERTTWVDVWHGHRLLAAQEVEATDA